MVGDRSPFKILKCRPRGKVLQDALGVGGRTILEWTLKKQLSLPLSMRNRTSEFHKSQSYLVYDEEKYILIFIQSYIEILTASLVQRLVCLTIDHEVGGSILGISTNLKCGLGLERGPPSPVRTIGQLFDGEVADLIKKVDIIRLDGA